MVITAHRGDSLIMDMLHLHLPREVWEYPLFLTEVTFRLSPLPSIPPSFVFWPQGFRPACSTREVHTRLLRSSEHDPVGVQLLGPYNWAKYHSDVTKGVSVCCLWVTRQPQIYSFCKLSSNRPFGPRRASHSSPLIQWPQTFPHPNLRP